MLGSRRANTAERLPGQPRHLNHANVSALGGPQFIVTVDTEEEFDWSAPFSRSGYGLRHVAEITTFQNLCDENGVSPIYLIDYPIASDMQAVTILRHILDDGRCEIGAQLHGWVTPPFAEEVNAFNSYACNLPASLEREKLQSLVTKIVEQFGVTPDMYRAGRYGAGPNTVPILQDLGIKIDSSVRSLFNYTSQGGPDYAHSALVPYWLNDDVLELPLTTVFAGALRMGGRQMFGNIFESDASRSFLARSGLLERVALTPEGIPVAKALEAIDIALEMGIPVLNFSFHSPSLQPGHTPYVRTEADLALFYDWWHAIFRHLAKVGVKPTTVKAIAAAAR